MIVRLFLGFSVRDEKETGSPDESGRYRSVHGVLGEIILFFLEQEEGADEQRQADRRMQKGCEHGALRMAEKDEGDAGEVGEPGAMKAADNFCASCRDETERDGKMLDLDEVGAVGVPRDPSE